mmetsp:Transcript_74306/g.111952  ORF Transcript_74306/g.111952 Transcript_74306/m.111952 type:complete len:112 (-) Transcript_74306:25-360(-)
MEHPNSMKNNFPTVSFNEEHESEYQKISKKKWMEATDKLAHFMQLERKHQQIAQNDIDTAANTDNLFTKFRCYVDAVFESFIVAVLTIPEQIYSQQAAIVRPEPIPDEDED